MLMKHLESPLSSLFGFKFGATGAPQDRSTLLKDITHITCPHRFQMTADKTGIATPDTKNLPTFMNSSPDHGADRRIHSWSISSAR
jgi:hypothetical protein